MRREVHYERATPRDNTRGFKGFVKNNRATPEKWLARTQADEPARSPSAFLTVARKQLDQRTRATRTDGSAGTRSACRQKFSLMRRFAERSFVAGEYFIGAFANLHDDRAGFAREFRNIVERHANRIGDRLVLMKDQTPEGNPASPVVRMITS